MLLILLGLVADTILEENVKFKVDDGEGNDFSFIQMNGPQFR